MNTLVLHEPVMVEECVTWLRPEHADVLVDATAGHGGHAVRLAERMRPDALLVLVDAQQSALDIASGRVAETGVNFLPLRGNFRSLADLLQQAGIAQIDGVLYDQGLCSADFDSELGFSFQKDAPLDMRRDETAPRSAAHLLATLSEAELTRIFREYGDERWARAIARAIVTTRRERPIRRTTELVEIIERTVPRAAWPKDIHVATRCFLALRYAVNDDINAIQESIRGVVPMLRPGGRIVCLSYCSTEDAAVRAVFRELEKPCICPPRLPVCVCQRKPLVRSVTRKGVRPAPEEVARNRRARSAVARVVERLAEDCEA